MQHHLGETERQLERIEDCLDALGEDAAAAQSSSAPSPVGSTVPCGNGELHEAFADFALENYEIAAYRSLLTLCEMAVQRSIVPLLQESLKEEEAMARWVKDNISRLTRDYVIECERTAGNAEETAMKEIKPPRPDIGGQRGQGDERDHEPHVTSKTPVKRKESGAKRQGAK
jgi:hypothetical protein